MQNRTGNYGSPNYPVSCSGVWASNRNFQNFGLPIDIVPCFNHCNVYILRKLQVWRAQKFNFLVSAKIAQTGTGQETTPCLAAQYLASNRNFQNFGATYRHGTMFAPKQCLYCKKATSVESPIMQFPSHCKNRTNCCGSTNYPVPCRTLGASNRNFQNFGDTYRHGTVFVPMQCLY